MKTIKKELSKQVNTRLYTDNELKFISSLNNKIKNNMVDIHVNKLLQYSKNQFLETTYNTGDKEIVEGNIEYLLCKLSPVYFADSYSWIEHPIKGIIPFKMFYFQKYLLNAIHKQNQLIIFKDRQIGVSTVTASYCMWLANFFSAKFLEVISIKENKAQQFKKKCDIVYRKMPVYMRTSLMPGTKGSKTQLELKNSSIIMSEASGDNPSRGDAVSMFVVDEAAFNRNIEDAWAAIYPAAEKGKIIIISTPNGIADVGEWYFRKWSEAKNKQNDFFPLEFYWWEFPDRQNDWIAEMVKLDYRNHPEIMDECIRRGNKIIQDQSNPWIEKCRDNLGEVQFRQEILHEFVVKGSNVFDNDVLTRIQNGIVRPTVVDRLATTPLGGFWMWKEIDVSGKYIVGCLPDEEIITTETGLKKIKDIKLGETIVDQSGNTDMVVSTSSRFVEDEKLYYIQTNGMLDGTFMTGEHPIKVGIGNDLGFIFAKDVNVNHWLYYPLHKYKVEYTGYNSDPMLSGLLLVNPHSIIKTENDVVTVELEIRQALLLDLKERNKTEIIKLTEKDPFNRNWLNIQFNIPLKEYEQLFGIKLGSYKWIYGMSDDWINSFLYGIFCGSGVLTRKIERRRKVFKIQKYFRLKFSIDHKFTVHMIQEILFHKEIFARANIEKQKSGDQIFVDLGEWETLRLLLDFKLNMEELGFTAETIKAKLKRKPNRKNFKFCDDYILFRITKIGTVNYTGTVRNLETERHTYCGKFITLHNCDVADGTGRDFSSIVVLDSEKMEVVAEYKNQITTEEFSKVVKAVCKYFNNAYLIIESTGLGQSVFDGVYGGENPYTNVLRFKRKKDNVEKYTSWLTNNTNRPLLMNFAYNTIYNDEVKIYSERLFEEIRTLIWNGNRIDHSKNTNDDLWFALCIALYNRGNAYYNEENFMMFGDEMIDIIPSKTNKSTEIVDDNKLVFEELIDISQNFKDKVEKQYGMPFEMYQSLFGKK